MTPTVRVNLALAAAFTSLAVLGACMTTTETARTASTPNIIPQTFPYTPGSGTVQTMGRIPPDLSAAAGSSAPGTGYRLGIRMDNGSFQYVDVDGGEFSVGTRIELAPDRTYKRI